MARRPKESFSSGSRGSEACQAADIADGLVAISRQAKVDVGARWASLVEPKVIGGAGEKTCRDEHKPRHAKGIRPPMKLRVTREPDAANGAVAPHRRMFPLRGR